MYRLLWQTKFHLWSTLPVLLSTLSPTGVVHGGYERWTQNRLSRECQDLSKYWSQLSTKLYNPDALYIHTHTCRPQSAEILLFLFGLQLTPRNFCSSDTQVYEWESAFSGLEIKPSLLIYCIDQLRMIYRRCNDCRRQFSVFHLPEPRNFIKG